jgi:glycosyltransferase involved in cell wall biosynthesis
MGSPFISVVVPIYKTDVFLDELIFRLEKALSKITDVFEIILVDDASPDKSWHHIESLIEKKPQLLGIKFSRNFGQHYAISAGLDHAKGDWIVVMDGDLQDQPEEIIKLYNQAMEGYQIVLASRLNRQDNFLKRLFSKLFYLFLTYLTGSKHDETVANFGIYHFSVIREVKRMRESIRYFPTMVKWVGFKVSKINVEHALRSAGQSSYDFKRLANLALDIMLAYSDKPLRLTIKFGFTISFLAFIATCFTILQWIRGEIIVLGYASIIISIWFLSGCILITLGIVGLYVGKIFEGVKNRPIYIIDKMKGKF